MQFVRHLLRLIHIHVRHTWRYNFVRMLLSFFALPIAVVSYAAEPAPIALPEFLFFSNEIRPLDRMQKVQKLVVLPAASEEDDDPEELFHVTPADIIQLEKALALEELEFRQVDIAAEQLLRLKRLPKLRIVELQGAPDMDAKFAALSQFPALEKVRVVESDLSDKAAEYLSKMPKLKVLELIDCKVTSHIFATHHMPKSLESLYVTSDNLGIEFLSVSLFNSSLRELDLGWTSYDSERKTSNQTIPKFKALPNLRTLNLGFISYQQTQNLRKAYPNLSVNGDM